MTGDDTNQRTIEGLVVTTAEELERVVERVLTKHGLIQIAKASKWDRSYKGDDRWLEFRVHVVRLVVRNVILAYRDLDQDPFFRKDWGIVERTQWKRAVDQRLIPNKPAASDGHEFAAFTLGGARDTRYLTFRSWLHCAISIAAKERKDPVLLRRVREHYRATEPCGRCTGLTGAELVTSPSQSLQSPRGRYLDEEERAILTAEHSQPEAREGGD